MNWNFEMSMYLAVSIALLGALAAMFHLADKLGSAEFERDLFKSELLSLRAYRAARETYDSQG